MIIYVNILSIKYHFPSICNIRNIYICDLLAIWNHNYKVIVLRLPISFHARYRLHKNFPTALLWETYFCCLCLRIHIPTQFSEKVIICHTWYTFSYIHLSVNLYIYIVKHIWLYSMNEKILEIWENHITYFFWHTYCHVYFRWVFTKLLLMYSSDLSYELVLICLS